MRMWERERESDEWDGMVSIMRYLPRQGGRSSFKIQCNGE